MAHSSVFSHSRISLFALLILPWITAPSAWADPAQGTEGKKIAFSAMSMNELSVLVPTVTLATALQEADKALSAAQNSYPIAEQCALWDTAVKLVAGAQGLAILRELKFAQAAALTETPVLATLKTLPLNSSPIADENGGPVTTPQSLVADENGGPVTQPIVRAGKIVITPIKSPILTPLPALRTILPRSVKDENGGPVTKPPATPRITDENGGPVTKTALPRTISDENGGPVTKPAAMGRVMDENGGPVTMGGSVKSLPARNF